MSERNQGGVVKAAKRLGMTAVAVALGMALAACGSSRTIEQGNEYLSIDEEKYIEALATQDDAEFFDSIRAWSVVIKDEPRWAVAHFNIGLIYDQLNMVDEAIRHYEIAVSAMEDSIRVEAYEEVQPRKDIDAHLARYNLHLGTAYLRADYVEEAEMALLEALKYAPYEPALHYNLAACFMAKNQFDTALLHADNAVDLAAQPAGTEDGSNLAPQVDVEKLGMYVLRQAECHMARGEWDKAHVAMKRAKEQCHMEAPPHMWDRWHTGRAEAESDSGSDGAAESPEEG